MISMLKENVLPQSKFTFAGILALILAFATVFAYPSTAFSDVRKADIVYGETADSRSLPVAQCPDIEADYAIVIDSKGTVYFERDAQSSAQIASLTKIMTAITALDTVEDGIVTLDTEVKISAKAASIGESSAGLKKGDVLTLRTALTALLVPSGNDAAVAIAETVGDALANQGSTEKKGQEAFIAQMNTLANEIGCKDTVFENPHGLDFDEYEGNLHSTAEDMAKIVRYGMKNDTFRQDVNLGNTSITVNREGVSTTISLKTTNVFSDYTKYAIGVKTGYTSLAGACFAGATDNEEQELYAIVLNSSDEAQRFRDAATLTDWVYEHIISYPLANSEETASIEGKEVAVVAHVAHQDWIDKTVKATLSDPSAAATIFDLNGNVSQSIEFNDLHGDIHIGDKVGTATFKQRNQVIATVDVVACEDVEAPGFFEGIGIWWKRLFMGISGESKVADSVILNELPLLIDKTSALLE